MPRKNNRSSSSPQPQSPRPKPPPSFSLAPFPGEEGLPIRAVAILEGVTPEETRALREEALRQLRDWLVRYGVPEESINIRHPPALYTTITRVGTETSHSRRFHRLAVFAYRHGFRHIERDVKDPDALFQKGLAQLPPPVGGEAQPPPEGK